MKKLKRSSVKAFKGSEKMQHLSYFLNSSTLQPVNDIFQSLPDGQPRRMLDTQRAGKEFNFKAKVDFEQGLREMISWYCR